MIDNLYQITLPEPDEYDLEDSGAPEWSWSLDDNIAEFVTIHNGEVVLNMAGDVKRTLHEMEVQLLSGALLSAQKTINNS